MNRLLLALAGILFALAPFAAQSQGYPQRAVKMIVPFAAGGLTDGLGRVVALYLAERLGQPVVVENRGGGGGTVGTEAAARSTPDGYTMLLGSLEGYGMTNADAKRLNYNPEKDLAPIALVARAPNVIIVHPSVKANTIKELIELARANPGKIRYASPGIGSNPHIIGERLKQRFNIDIVHVPYKGGGAGINDLISGQIEMMFAGVVTSAGHIKSGKARGLGITGTVRVPMIPDVPTMAEAGVSDFALGPILGTWTPAGAPAEAIARLTQEVVAVKKLPEFRKRLADLGYELSEDLTGAAFGSYMVAEAKRWRDMAAAAGLKD
jgi:tripartite-type tricarboxylate transporter receptor subunit TctC